MRLANNGNDILGNTSIAVAGVTLGVTVRGGRISMGHWRDNASQKLAKTERNVQQLRPFKLLN